MYKILLYIQYIYAYCTDILAYTHKHTYESNHSQSPIVQLRLHHVLPILFTLGHEPQGIKAIISIVIRLVWTRSNRNNYNVFKDHINTINPNLL